MDLEYSSVNSKIIRRNHSSFTKEIKYVNHHPHRQQAPLHRLLRRQNVIFYKQIHRLFAQKIDVNHILNTEVYQSHISRARFWIIRTNIYNQENLVHELCKNLVNRGSTSINFEFSITKIALGQQLAYNEEKRVNTPNERYMRNSLISGYITPNALKTLPFPQFMNLNKQQSHTKTASSFEWSHQSEFGSEEQKKTQQKQNSTAQNGKDQQNITLKPLLKKEFEVGSLSQLSAIFMSREGIFTEFGMSQETVMKSKRMITTYLFRQNDIEIGLSVISEGCRKYLQKAINIEISEAFNLQFNSRKQAYQNTCLTQNFSTSTIPKSSTKLGHEMQKQTYHKVLLFLFTHYDPQSQKGKVSSSTLSQPNGTKQISKFIQSIQEWKMKDQDINITEKLSKEYVLIKQEVENEKVSFKNKLKIFQAIIGESVNVDKLLNEEKQMENSTTNTNLNNPPQNLAVNVAINDINSRISRKSQLRSMLNSPQQMAASSNNSEFKRLKQSFEMIRNIDNIINEQTKKIETLKLYQKQVVKSKNQILYKNAKSLNQVKKQIKEIKDEIEQKKTQYQIKNQKLENQKHQKKRNFIPTPQAQQLLNSNVKVFQKIIQNQKTNKNNEKYLVDDQIPISNTSGTNKENHQRLKHNNTTLEQDPKKSFFIRKQHSSFYTNNLNNTSTNASQHKQNTQLHVENLSNNNTLLTLYKSEQQKQTKLMKKRRQQVQNHNIWLNVRQQQNRKSSYNQKSEEMSNDKEKQILLMLYDYFVKNRQLIDTVNSEISSNMGLNNPRMNLTMENASYKSQLLNNANSRMVHCSLHTKQRTLMNSSASQLNLHKSSLQQTGNFLNKTQSNTISFPLTYSEINLQQFPLLNETLNPRMSESAFESEQCSMVSDIISESKVEVNAVKSPNKRVTIQNMMQKK